MSTTDDLADERRNAAAQRLADYIKATVAGAPPLTPAQRHKLALLIRAGGRDA